LWQLNQATVVALSVKNPAPQRLPGPKMTQKQVKATTPCPVPPFKFQKKALAQVPENTKAYDTN